MQPLSSYPGLAAGGAAHVPDARIDYLDGWRGLAILIVLQEHFLPIPGIKIGRLGVDVFFCLSGLLMSNLLFIRRVRLVDFYKRRISRIVPAFVVFVGAVFGVAAGFGKAPSGIEVVSTFLFLRTYIPAQPDLWSTGLPIGHLWSLNVEEHSYVLLSVLALLAIDRRRVVLILAGLVLVAFGLTHWYAAMPAWGDTPFQIRTEVAATFLLASAGYRLVRDRFDAAVRPWMPVAAFIAAVLTYLPGAPWKLHVVLAPLALAFAVNHLGRVAAPVRATLETRALRKAGIWSFSIYLWQQPFYAYRDEFPPFVALAGALLAGILSFHLLEDPCRRWLNAHW